VHELGLCEGIVEAAARRAGDRQVRGLRVRIGGHDAVPEAMAGLASDELVGHLLILHGLSPVPVRERIVSALKGVKSPGGDIRLAGLDGGVARVQLAVHGCSSTTASLRDAITAVVLAMAPELAAVEVEPAPVATEPALIPVEAVLRSGPVRVGSTT
jgi:Fe-S cluster biogenesis protein NfuA